MLLYLKGIRQHFCQKPGPDVPEEEVFEFFFEFIGATSYCSIFIFKPYWHTDNIYMPLVTPNLRVIIVEKKRLLNFCF